MDGIAFEGCACRAAFHAGVAEALDDAGFTFARTAGTSSGAIIATAVAAGHAGALPDRWRAFAGRSVVSWRRALWNRSPFDMSHLVRHALTDALGDGDLRAHSTEALVTATRARDLAPMVFSSREVPSVIEPVMASCFIPVLYGRPVRVAGAWMLDGGVTDNLPVEALVARGAREVIAVTVRHDARAFKSPRQRAWVPTAEGARVHVIHPSRPLALKSWDFDRDAMARAIEAGWDAGRAFARG